MSTEQRHIDAIPPGWKLVPLEPTDEMLAAGKYRPGSTLRLQYYGMIDAAPGCQSSGCDADLIDAADEAISKAVGA